MPLRPEDITIAVTVYSRRDFVLGAIRSALNQTIPVRVIVVEDCGPDAGLRDFILSEFGNRIVYFCNPKNRGLFDNWNACMEYCTTPWLSILHDDDSLEPCFVEAMLSLAELAPTRGIYFGQSALLHEGRLSQPPPATWNRWRDIEAAELAESCFVMFPGQLFRIQDAKAVGGFRKTSYLTGDWELWFNVVLRSGGAQSDRVVSTVRSHFGKDRGSSLVERRGVKWVLDNVQRKRNLLKLRREKGISVSFDRAKFLKDSPIPSRLLLRDAHWFSPRMLNYNAWVFKNSAAPNIAYRALQAAVGLFGPATLRGCSKLWNRAR
jgi:glycosyltransferase involved in cell wall biosynthesis